jgi:DNA repair exonuclease SbcCD ATPase subunit
LKIKTLELKSWKAFENLTLDIADGTTFLVARNGLGKTSITQALYFAIFGKDRLFGSGSHISSAIRAGATSASVKCDLVVGRSRISISRQVYGEQKNSRPAVTVMINNEVSNELAYYALLHENSGVDVTELELLSFMSENASSSTDDLGFDIANSLAATFGVDRLKQRANELTSQARKLDLETDKLRKNLRNVPRKEEAKHQIDLTAQIDAERANLVALHNQLDEMKRSLEIQQAWVAFDEAVKLYSQWSATNLESIETLNRSISDAQIIELRGANLISKTDLVELAKLLTALIESTGREVNKCETILDLTHKLMGQIELGHGTCPVCRRPLSDFELDAAIAGHNLTIEVTTSELNSARNRSLTLESLREVTSRLVNAVAPAEPTPPSTSREGIDPNVTSQIAEIQQKIEETSSRRAELETRLKVSIENSEASLNDQKLSDELFVRYREVERGFLAAEVLTELANVITARRIEPLAAQVQKKWPDLHLEGNLMMSGQGSLSIDVQGTGVPFSEFSGGEKTVANIVLRLLTLEIATKNAVAVFDEPLEHLDPKNRSLLASLLTLATQAGSRIEQLIVTTYEESVTRRIPLISGEIPSQVLYID